MGGFPCKNVSSLTTTPGSVKDGSCESGRGWIGIQQYCARHKPSLLLLENVGTLFSRRKVEGGITAQLDSIKDHPTE